MSNEAMMKIGDFITSLFREVRPLTPVEAEEAYREATPVHMTEDEVKRIVSYASSADQETNSHSPEIELEPVEGE